MGRRRRRHSVESDDGHHGDAPRTRRRERHAAAGTCPHCGASPSRFGAGHRRELGALGGQARALQVSARALLAEYGDELDQRQHEKLALIATEQAADTPEGLADLACQLEAAIAEAKHQLRLPARTQGGATPR